VSKYQDKTRRTQHAAAAALSDDDRQRTPFPRCDRRVGQVPARVRRVRVFSIINRDAGRVGRVPSASWPLVVKVCAEPRLTRDDTGKDHDDDDDHKQAVAAERRPD
jgi:hypothetical protein